MRELKEREKIGEYEVLRHPGGGATIFGKFGKKGKAYLPPDRKLRQYYRENGLTQGLIARLQLRGILVCGRKSSLEGRKAVKIPSKRAPDVTLNEIERAVRRFWPEKKVREYLSGKKVELKPIQKFSEQYNREWRAAHRVHGRRLATNGESNFKAVLEQIYPGLYVKLSRTKWSNVQIDLDELRETLKQRFQAGDPISKSALKNSSVESERYLYAQIDALSRQEMFGNKAPFSKIVEKITGISCKNINVTSGGRKIGGILTEEMTYFLVSWARVLGFELGQVPVEEPASAYNSQINFINKKKNYKADVRVGNHAIEVKFGLNRLSSTNALSNLLEKYSGENAYWEDGTPIEGVTVAFHQRPYLYKDTLVSLKEAGISVLTYPQLHSGIKRVVRSLPRFREDLSRVKPKVNNLDYLISVHEEVALMPSLLLRPANYERLIWTIDLYRGLRKTAQEISDAA